MDELRDLYQEIILDHGKAPRNFRHPESANREAYGHNPLCGDRVRVFVTVDDAQVVTDVAFEGKGCAICLASASMMTELMRGRTVSESRGLFDRFRAMIKGNGSPADSALDGELGTLTALSGVKAFPSRIKCASLPWHTYIAALDGRVETTATESRKGPERSMHASSPKPTRDLTDESLTLADFMPRPAKASYSADGVTRLAAAPGNADLAAPTRDAVIAAVKTVQDPEIPVDLFNLGLIYKIEIDDTGHVAIDMTLTAPACPVAGTMPVMVAEAVVAVPGVKDCAVALVWDPPWTKDRMSEEARLLLDMF